MFWLGSRFNFVQGTRAALSLGGVGAVAPVALMVGSKLIDWSLRSSLAFDRQYDLAWLSQRLLRPTFGCALIFAATGWATFAPVGRYRFTSTLAIISAASVVGWFILMSLQLTPQRLKGMDHPRFYLSELMILLAPPILAAVLSAQIRSSLELTRKPVGSDRDFGQESNYLE